MTKLQDQLEDLRGKLPIHNTKRYSKRSLTDIRSIAIHHSMTKAGHAKSFANYHVNTNGWPGIGYHYVILKDGTIQWCWDVEIKSYHVGNSNREAIGICMVGDFRTESPTKAQLDSLNTLIQAIRSDINPNLKVLGHNEYPSYSWKKCPAIDMNTIRALIPDKTLENRIKDLEDRVAALEKA